MRSDAQLLIRIADEDRGAFHLLFERHSDRIFRFALSLTRSPHLAEEVLQETMMAVWKGAKRFKGRSKVTTWILGIAKNQARNLLRREERGSRLPASKGPTPDPSEDARMSVQVERALDTLPPRLLEPNGHEPSLTPDWLDRQIAAYYEVRGWDAEGRPMTKPPSPVPHGRGGVGG